MRIPNRIYRHLSFKGDFHVPTQNGRGFKMRSEGHVIENNIYWAGLEGYEPESVKVWLDLAARAQVVLDIGANSGLYALLAASVSPAAEVHAFEPLKRIAEVLRYNVGLNPSFRIHVHEMAIGDKTGTAEMYDPGGKRETSASLNSSFRSSWKDHYPVPVARVDDFITEKRIEQVDLIKLDVEGFEEFAIDGMLDTLHRYKPAMMLELLPKATPRLLEQLERLEKSGFTFYQLTEHGPRASRVERPSTGRNVLLAPASRVL